MAGDKHDGAAEVQRKAVIGNSENFWLFSSRSGFDLTHPTAPDSSAIEPRVTMSTASSPVAVDPAKTALVIVDMQNFFLSPALGRDAAGAGHEALKRLVDYAIPAARISGTRVIWLNWGLTEREVDDMPPAIKRAFGFEAVSENAQALTAPGESEKSHGVDRDGTAKLGSGKDSRIYKGLGSDCGIITDPMTGNNIHAGRLLMRDQWNTALYPPLDEIYHEGVKLDKQPDVWIHKNRMSGMWGARTDLEDFLQKNGITTLLLAGVNTDQCVGGTLQDAFSKGYDCILLSDGAGTTSPDFAQKCIEYNGARSWGFVATCLQFAEGVAQAFPR